MSTRQWLAIEPVDTLFFRGAESMVAGENHEVDTMFPPMPSTLIGALRTAIMVQNNLDPQGWQNDPERWQSDFPILGTPEKAGFSLIGPLLMVGNQLLLPAPAHWFVSNLPDENKADGQTVRVQPAEPLNPFPLGLQGSSPAPFWVKKPQDADMKPLSGWWVTAAAFDAVARNRELTCLSTTETIYGDQAAIVSSSALFVREERIGIALTPHRKALDGHLYSARHIRLKEGIRLAVAVKSSHSLAMAKEGIIQLGGEQRICHYHKIPAPQLPRAADNSNLLIALGPLCLEELVDLADCSRISGKLLRVGGWDMQKNFHKPMTAWLPAGTVFVANSPGPAENIIEI